ncbi:hypothetical protein C8J57DRAFT_995332, partial [Mycena rebaudengoi]
LVKCINKYGMEFVTINPTESIQREMPLWYHPRERPDKRQENNGRRAGCLQDNHGIFEVGAGLDLAQRLEDPLHGPRVTCECDGCDKDHTTRGCDNPHACATAAASHLYQILPKWVP